MAVKWNEEIVLLDWSGAAPPTAADFDMKTRPQEAEVWFHAVEAFSVAYANMLFRPTPETWALDRSTQTIFSPSDIRAEWPNWLDYVRKFGQFGR